MPIVIKAANIPFGGTVKCRRRQFPVVSPSAITIHKWQGGTFDEVVFNYDQAKQTQLVYVALSRVTSIDGLYLTNYRDDFKFYYGQGSMAPKVKKYVTSMNEWPNTGFPRCQCKLETSAKLSKADKDSDGEIHRRH